MLTENRYSPRGKNGRIIAVLTGSLGCNLKYVEDAKKFEVCG